MWRCLTLYLVVSASAASDYYQRRAVLIEKSQNRSIGADLVLNADERKVNRLLMQLKHREFDAGFKDPEKFLPLRHFFLARDNITRSGVFKLIRQMPKGASLHSHDLGLVSDAYVFHNLTFRKNLWAKPDPEGRYTFRFSRTVPDDDGWEEVDALRRSDPSFDARLRAQLTLVVPDPFTAYSDIDVIWRVFEGVFRSVGSLLAFRPAFEDYFYRALEELHEDNVKYLEFRGLLPEVYDLDGRVYTPEEVLGLYDATATRFKRAHPDFVGVRFIYAPSRRVNASVVADYVALYERLHAGKYSKFLAGFDLVGQEDLGRTLLDFVPQLLTLGNRTKFFFHAGETDWSYEPSDLNLYDAVLLNATRIGHGYAILKHPELLRIVKERAIAIEVAPISNQVLKLVDDVRNHPANFLVANGYPVVIACDDPGLWGARGLSFDFYVAFMGLSGREGDLRLLKRLAINSIEYSSLDERRKRYAMKRWRQEWDQFVAGVIRSSETE
ncbi:adenosine deaminase 2-like [Cylas formicarius]|uniref:adenosine deaminase 2-like n=1 Tax=Cylas formicarius TaxID=197179 RepID=UPI002958A983|nr:adenosine deaminase 2-like [Cylas formicarius]